MSPHINAFAVVCSAFTLAVPGPSLLPDWFHFAAIVVLTFGLWRRAVRS